MHASVHPQKYSHVNTSYICRFKTVFNAFPATYSVCRYLDVVRETEEFIKATPLEITETGLIELLLNNTLHFTSCYTKSAST